MSEALTKLRSKMVKMRVVDNLRSRQRAVSKAMLLRSAKAAKETFSDEELAQVKHDILQRALS